MSSGPAKVFIKIESSTEQQENLKNIRKQLKPLQATAGDKENLTGRQILVGKGHLKSKSEIEISSNVNESAKRKKCETKSTQTEAFAIQNNQNENESGEITAEDLTNANDPGEHYWKKLAEKRRQALDDTLEENRKLYERIENLEEELETSRHMIKETNALVEVLTEMLNENGNEEDEEQQQDDEQEDKNDPKPSVSPGNKNIYNREIDDSNYDSDSD